MDHEAVFVRASRRDMRQRSATCSAAAVAWRPSTNGERFYLAHRATQECSWRSRALSTSAGGARVIVGLEEGQGLRTSSALSRPTVRAARAPFGLGRHMSTCSRVSAAARRQGGSSPAHCGRARRLERERRKDARPAAGAGGRKRAHIWGCSLWLQCRARRTSPRTRRSSCCAAREKHSQLLRTGSYGGHRRGNLDAIPRMHFASTHA